MAALFQINRRRSWRANYSDAPYQCWQKLLRPEQIRPIEVPDNLSLIREEKTATEKTEMELIVFRVLRV